jgi:hypothetical protein
MLPYISFTSGAQDGVYNGVYQHVRVRMAQQAF